MPAAVTTAIRVALISIPPFQPVLGGRLKRPFRSSEPPPRSRSVKSTGRSLTRDRQRTAASAMINTPR